MHILEAKNIGALLDALRERGYTTIGPTIRDGAIALQAIDAPDDLPRGWTDEQQPGAYTLVYRADGAYFGYVVGPYSWKKFLYPPRELLFRASREGKGFRVEGENSGPVPRYAFLGVRSCELHALRIHDAVFEGGEYREPRYDELRRSALIIAVECVEAGNNCFCVSMKTGPAVTDGFDVAMTEVIDGGVHQFVLRAGSPKGEELCAALPLREATSSETRRAEEYVSSAAGQMGRSLATDGLPQILNESFEHPQWDDIAKRCLGCTNCTMVCPTCFCSTVEEHTSLTGEGAERWRRWDSCFTAEFTKVAGGNIRMSTRTRYRQWLMHKLAYWVDQFGTFGCVGCGRCITWCPVGIDITAETRKIRESSISSVTAG